MTFTARITIPHFCGGPLQLGIQPTGIPNIPQPLVDALHSALTSTAVPSIKASFGSLLASAAGVDERLRTFVASELQRVDAEARGR